MVLLSGTGSSGNSMMKQNRVVLYPLVKISFSLLPVIVILIISGCAGLMEEQQRVEFLNKRIGYHVQTEAKRTFVLLHDPVITLELKELVQKISSYAALTWQVQGFYVINSPGLNVFATPEGSFFITSGFLDILSTQGELAFVIARAMMVLALNDDIARIVSEKLTSSSGSTIKVFLSDTLNFAAALSLTIATGTPTQLITEPEQEMQLEESGSVAVSYAFPYIVNQQYDEALQLRADRKGAVLIKMAGYDPASAVAVFERCEKFRQSNSQALSLSPFISKAPDLEERIEELQDFLTD
jgi:predicted Zn-dependent protease